VPHFFLFVAKNFFCTLSSSFRFSLHLLNDCCCILSVKWCVMCISNSTVASKPCEAIKGIHKKPTCIIMLQGLRTFGVSAHATQISSQGAVFMCTSCIRLLCFMLSECIDYFVGAASAEVYVLLDALFFKAMPLHGFCPQPCTC
jgi:hypothetical protein